MWMFSSDLRSENFIYLLALHQMIRDKKPTVQWHSFAQCLTARICPDKMFIAISTHKSLVKVISESKFEGSTEFYLSSLRNYSFLFHSVALMSKKKGLSARRRNSGTDILNVIVMQIYGSGEVKLLFIVLQFKTISSFTTRKELRATGKWQFSTDFCQNIQPC